jgi:hypothetical protein
MQRSREYLIADAVLSGLPIPLAPVEVPIDETRREMKMCESCPRNFTRPIGSKIKNCPDCNAGRRRYN